MLTRIPPGRYHRQRIRSRDERGSLILALSVIMIVVAVLSVFAAEVIGNEFLVVHRQHYQGAIAAADAGLSDALFRIDQIPASAYPDVSNFCVAPSGCLATSVPGLDNSSPAGTAEYSATYDATNDTWTVMSKGTLTADAANSAAVEEILWRSAEYPYAMFGNQGLDYNGISAAGFQTYTTGQSVEQLTAGPVKIGSNGTIDCNGSLPTNVSYWTWSGGGGVSSCQSATTTNTIESPTLYNLPVKTSWPADAQPLPSDPTSSDPYACALGHSDGTTQQLAGGDYYCQSTLTIYGPITVASGQSVHIYLIPPNTDPAFTGTVFDVNAPKGTAVNGPSSSGLLPDPTQLEIFSDSQGYFGNANGSNYFTLGAVVDAPNASLVGDGCKSTYYGALIINTLTCNGSPNLTVNYDESLGAIKGNWQTAGYRQIPPGQVNP